MFKFNEIKQVHLEISNNCQASCPMCSRNIDSGKDNPLIKINDWSFDDFKTIMYPEFLKQLHSFYFCGTFGDPMLNNDLIKMCAYAKVTAPTVHVAVHTNGGARTTDWWQKLAQALPDDHIVVFALDGLEDTHHLYRVGTKFETVLKNAQAFIAAGGQAEWCYIKFKHNEHQVETARQMSEDLGFTRFTLKNSSRFIIEPRQAVVDRSGNLTHYVEPATDTPLKFIDRKVIQAYKEILADSTIHCKAQHENEVYIDAYKDFYPCCWMANIPYTVISDDEAAGVRNEMKRQHEDMSRRLGTVNLIERPLQDIIDSDAFQTMWDDYWHKEKMIVCARSCGVGPTNNFAKFKDQEVK